MSSTAPSRSITFATNLVTLLLVLTTAFGLFVVVKGIVDASRGSGDVAAHQELDLGAVDALPPNTVAPQTVPITVRIRNASSEQVLYAMGRDLAPGFLIIAILWLLRSILRSVRQGDPFTAANVKRLRTIALLLVVGVPLVQIIASAFEQAIASSTMSPGLGIAVPLDMGGPIAGLGVFVLAQVFAHGVTLREDIEGTI